MGSQAAGNSVCVGREGIPAHHTQSSRVVACYKLRNFTHVAVESNASARICPCFSPNWSALGNWNRLELRIVKAALARTTLSSALHTEASALIQPLMGAWLSRENQHMLSEIVLGLLGSTERLCIGAMRLVFATDGFCVRATRGLIFTPIRSVLKKLLPLPPASAPQPFAVAEGAMAPPEAAPPASVPLTGFLVASSMAPARTDRPASPRPPTPDSSDI